MNVYKDNSRRRQLFWQAVCSALLGAVALPSTTVRGHHSPQGIYFTDRIVEVEGEVTDIIWQNPHVRFTIAAVDEQGETASWAVESVPVTRLRRAGVSPDIVEIGQRVRVAGNPSRRPENDLYAVSYTHLTLPTKA